MTAQNIIVTNQPCRTIRIWIPKTIILNNEQKKAFDLLSIWGGCDGQTDDHISWEIPKLITLNGAAGCALQICKISSFNVHMCTENRIEIQPHFIK